MSPAPGLGREPRLAALSPRPRRGGRGGGIGTARVPQWVTWQPPGGRRVPRTRADHQRHS